MNSFEKFKRQLHQRISMLPEHLQEAQITHGDKYDYSLIKEEDIKKGLKSRVTIICNDCGDEFSIQLGTHIFLKVAGGCAECRRKYRKPTYGEKLCTNHLNTLNIEYEWEWRLPNVDNFFYDFIFRHNNQGYVLDYDGQQHFEYTPQFHSSERNFSSQRDSDVRKAREVISAGYYLIRIDHTQVNFIPHHIDTALQTLNNQNMVYYSTPDMYLYISDYINK